MRTLVYVGTNDGRNLEYLTKAFSFQKAYGFEPDPETFLNMVHFFEEIGKNLESFMYNDSVVGFKFLINKCNVTILNCACSDSDGDSDFYVTRNKVASSLRPPSSQLTKIQSDELIGITETKTVKTINLLNFLRSEEVDFINYYYSDCQGSDFTVLKTLKEYYVDGGKIGELMLETHGNDKVLYEDLNNQFDKFKLLLSEKYSFICAILGAKSNQIVSENELDSNQPEWDSYWRLDGYGDICELRGVEELMELETKNKKENINFKIGIVGEN